MPVPHTIFRLLIVVSAMPLFLALAAKVATATPFSESNSSQPGLTASRSSVSFGNIQLGSSQAHYETLTNSGSSTLTISQALVSGTGFRLNGLSLPLSLDQDQSVTFRVVFAPKDEGITLGGIAVVSNASNPNLTIPLSGTGTAAGRLASSPTSLNFGSVAVGTSKTLTGSLTATRSSVTISSATSTSAEFHLGGLSLPKMIAVGESVSFTLTFTPQSSGTASGSIFLTSNAANTSTIETLTGLGTATTRGSITLRWNPSTSVAGYNVYRGGTSSGPYTRINPALAADANYVDDSVRGGTTYYYVTTAVGKSGAESKYSSPVQVVVPSP